MRFDAHSVKISMVFVCGLLSACASQQNRQNTNIDPSTRLDLAQAAEEGGNTGLAASLYSSVQNTPGDVTTQLRVADGLLRSGKVGSAEQTVKRALKTNPNNPDLIRALALIYVMDGRPEQAVPEFDQLLAIKPDDTRAIVDKGVALDLLHQHTEAQAQYRQALALAPDDPEVHNDLALSLMMQGRLQEAKATLASVGASETSSDRVRNNLGVIYAAGGDSQEARRLLGDSISPEALTALTNVITRSTPAVGPGK
jgi:Flp pilus assembly protein TadD